MAIELKRMRQLIGTAADWAANDLVIGDGELALVRDGAYVQQKTGDGVKRFSELPLALDQLLEPNGSARMSFTALGAGAVTRPVEDKLRDISVSVKDFGAIGDGVADDTAALLAAVAATPRAGRLHFPRGRYRTSQELRILHPMQITGDGAGGPFQGFVDGSFAGTDTGSQVIQTDNAKRVFVLVASQDNWAFGQWGITGVHFVDLTIQGRDANANKCVACIGVDTTVHAGDFHIRANSVTRCVLRHAVTACHFVGIGYLNNFFDTIFHLSTTGFKLSRGAASDSGGQTRFFGCTFGPCTVGASLNEDTVNGYFSFFGCTLADSQHGIKTNDDVGIVCIGNNFEANSIAGIYVLTPPGKVNSNSVHFRYIVGNEFFNNGADIWFDKQDPGFQGGTFSYPTLIDCNQLSSPLALKLTVPATHFGFDCMNFVFGASNLGPNSGAFAAGAISPLFFGVDQRRRTFIRRFVWSAATASGQVAFLLPYPFVPTRARAYLTANANAFTQLRIGDQMNDSRYIVMTPQSDALNTWVNWVPPVPQFVVDTTTNILRIAGTGGIANSAGVFEIEGYIYQP